MFTFQSLKGPLVTPAHCSFILLEFLRGIYSKVSLQFRPIDMFTLVSSQKEENLLKHAFFLRNEPVKGPRMLMIISPPDRVSGRLFHSFDSEKGKHAKEEQ
jgi:hypothetical protein